MKIGFIGLGIMGSRMAANLLAAGHSLVVHNRSRQAAQTLEEKGAKWAPSPAEAARAAELVFTMVPTPEAVQEIALGENGMLDQMNENTLWVNTSTVNPSFAEQMADECTKRGLRYIDAPVAGSKGPAETGELVFFAGASPEDLAHCSPLFEVMGKKTVHAGGPGKGSGLKMAFNLMLGAGMAAFSEALALGGALGFSKTFLFDVLGGSPVVPAFIEGKRGKIESDDFKAEFPLKWMLKDLHLAALTAYEQETAMPLGNTIKEIYAMARSNGFGDDDFSAVSRYIEPASGGEPTDTCSL